MNRIHALPNAALEKRVPPGLARGSLPRGWISGLILSNDTTDATNDIGISAGACRSTFNLVDGVPSTLSQDQIDIEIPVAIIKQLDVSWAPENYDPEGFSGGGRSGGRSGSSLANGTWHAFAIGGPGEQADILFHDSVTQSSIIAALPQGYTAARRIGSIIRVVGAIDEFTQTGDYFRRKKGRLDMDTTSLSSAGATFTLGGVPSGVSVLALFNVYLNHSSSSAFLYMTNPDDERDNPNNAGVPLSTLAVASGGFASGQAQVQTNSAAQIFVDSNTAFTVLRAVTLGWWDDRGRND